ncbi:MAG: valine--tRNA ligase, partial [Lentisphaerae bacterium]|nr:valine--tRNA ligase [Lentisphaerota bacterium]
MEKNYDPKAVESRWYAKWVEAGLFHGRADAGGEPYCIVIPPPNVTGILHMGHALNNTIQDILARWRRMQGRNVVWLPGTDHAGIATQNVVERSLRAEGLTRQDLGREEFLKRVWQWRDQYGSTIIGQLKRLGASCDWDRERFTMDEGLSEAVAEVFVRLYEKGLIYRGKRIINWCPRCHTALSDEESEHAPEKGKLYYIRYPMAGNGGGHVTVATTRPETLLGDVAVAVHPDDSRYASLVSGGVILPVLGRKLAVIRDTFVDPQFGTGVVKVTPAHDPNDFEMGQRHGLEPICVMNGDGTMNDAGGPYAGLDRFECRKRILADLEAAGLLEKIDKHENAVGHCYRCDTVVEPMLSPQWFVKMKPLAAPAIEAVRSGKIVFVPERWTKVYLDWMENIRDWCISRQIWWGHRIPVFTCADCGHEWAARGMPSACPKCGAARFTQDDDVLDTWFSSWLWPFSTFGWPRESDDLARYYPTNDLVTASEIIFFWVARMIVAGHEFMGDAPFRTVYIHGTVRDDQGRKMSKSLGNSIDPLVIIDAFSADALRCSLMMITATGQDVFVSNDKFEIGRNFGTKIWNAARFMRMHSGDAVPDTGGVFAPGELSPDDLFLLNGLQNAIRGCTDNLEKYRFNDAVLAVYDFVWHEFCDWYIEKSKPALYEGTPDRKAAVLRVMHHVLSSSLRLLHPVMPFITEELWHEMGYGGDGGYIMNAPWPQPADAGALARLGATDEVLAYVAGKHEVVRAGRALKADFGIAASAEA